MMRLPSTATGRAGSCFILSSLAIALAAAASSADAAATLVVSDASVTAGRNTVTIPFVVSRSGDVGFAITFQYTTKDGSAIAGRDYTATSGSLTIPAGQTSATLSVPVLTKTARQAKSFTLLLSNASAQAPIGPVWTAASNVTSGRYAEGSAVADFNGDGKPDLALPSLVDKTVTVFRNDTAANAPQNNFAPGAVLSGSSGPTRLIAIDVNGDGKPDLVVPNLDSSGINVFLNTTPAGATTFSFTNTPIDTGASSIALTSADLDGDGKPDVVICGVTPGKVIVLLNRTPVGATVPSFANPSSFPVDATGTAYSYAITTLDFDGDGRPDVAIGNLRTSEVAILRNTTLPGAAAASFATPVAFHTADGATGLASADIDGDGKPDLVTAENGFSTTGTTWSVLLNRTPAGATVPQFAVTSQGGPAPYSVVLRDIDGDGRADVILASLLLDSVGNGGIAVLLNRTVPGASSASFVQSASLIAGDDPHTVAVADFNGDGRLDFATADSASTLTNFFFAVPPVANPQATIGDGSAVGTIQPRPPRP